ncbi:high mobility group box domain-containing protein, partial [Choanephora cucurbitarum]
MMCSKVDKDSKIPRPLNSFMIFRLEKQREITQLCPGANHRDMSKIISKWWHELPAEEKQVYIDQAAKTKKEHIMKYPGYKYRPKRNSKPKRAYKKHPE